MQRWLGIRLDFLGIVLTFVVAILTVATRFSISPSQTGVTLSYIISVQQAFGWMVRQSAEVENNMNSVERIVRAYSYYGSLATSSFNYIIGTLCQGVRTGNATRTAGRKTLSPLALRRRSRTQGC